VAWTFAFRTGLAQLPAEALELLLREIRRIDRDLGDRILAAPDKRFVPGPDDLPTLYLAAGLAGLTDFRHAVNAEIKSRADDESGR
jgi:hypothetical protein